MKTTESYQENYIQLPQKLFRKFNRDRVQVSLYQYQTSTNYLFSFCKNMQTLSAKKISEGKKLCAEGLLYIVQKDKENYPEYFSENNISSFQSPTSHSDLIYDKIKKEHAGESTGEMIAALLKKFNHFYTKHNLYEYKELSALLHEFTQRLYKDKDVLRNLLPVLFTEEFSSAKHAINTLLLGLWMYTEIYKEYTYEEFEAVALGLLIHDIGLSKFPKHTGKFDSMKKSKLQSHVRYGMEILSSVNSKPMPETVEAISEHHEQPNGKGYPQKLRKIGMIGKITAIADSLGTMILEKEYAYKKSLRESIVEIYGMKEQYDSDFIAVLIKGYKEGLFGNK